MNNLNAIAENRHIFSEKLHHYQPVASKFLESAIREGKISHAYMLEGSDIMAQYSLAMQMSKILNCLNTKSSFEEYDTACKCQNCNWISQNRHPEVITVSPIDYLYGNEDSKPTTKITIGQSRFLRNTLLKTSVYYRVVIFTNAQEGKEYEQQSEILWKDYKGELVPPALANSENERIGWTPAPLDRNIFNQESANALLKIIEEPPQKLIFFFLAKDRGEMLETIVSRVQVVPFVSRKEESPYFSLIIPFIQELPPKNYAHTLSLSEKLLSIAKENSLTEKALLVLIQQYLFLQLKKSASDRIEASRMIFLINKIQDSIKEIDNHISPQNVFDSLIPNLM